MAHLTNIYSKHKSKQRAHDLTILNTRCETKMMTPVMSKMYSYNYS